MGSTIVGVIGTLLGVIVGAAFQQLQAVRNRRWQKEDLFSTAKRAVYAEYLRSISASYAQAMSGHRSRTEDANLNAAAAEIHILSAKDVYEPARALADTVIEVHSSIAAGAGVAEAVIADVDRLRHEVIDLFKIDLEPRMRR